MSAREGKSGLSAFADAEHVERRNFDCAVRLLCISVF